LLAASGQEHQQWQENKTSFHGFRSSKKWARDSRAEPSTCAAQQDAARRSAARREKLKHRSCEMVSPDTALADRRSCRTLDLFEETYTMLHYAIVFLVIALIAAVLGFGGIAGAAAGIAKILFLVFLVLFVVSLVVGRRRPPV